MPAVQVPVALHPGIYHSPVKSGAHGQRSRPVLGTHHRFQAGEMALGHVHEAPLAQQGPSALLVPEADGAQQKASLEVEGLAVFEDLNLFETRTSPPPRCGSSVGASSAG